MVTVCARELADVVHSILLIDKRDHITGSAFDEHDDQGVLMHPYDSYIFILIASQSLRGCLSL